MDSSRIEELRAELWARVYAGIAASTSGQHTTALEWADRALKQFDERFPASPPVPPREPVE